MTDQDLETMAELVASLPPELQGWLFDLVDDLTDDLQALAILRQLWPGAELGDWRPSCPPPGMGWAEYESRLAELAKRRGRT